MGPNRYDYDNDLFDYDETTDTITGANGETYDGDGNEITVSD